MDLKEQTAKLTLDELRAQRAGESQRTTSLHGRATALVALDGALIGATVTLSRPVVEAAGPAWLRGVVAVLLAVGLTGLALSMFGAVRGVLKGQFGETIAKEDLETLQGKTWLTQDPQVAAARLTSTYVTLVLRARELNTDRAIALDSSYTNLTQGLLPLAVGFLVPVVRAILGT